MNSGSEWERGCHLMACFSSRTVQGRGYGSGRGTFGGAGESKEEITCKKWVLNKTQRITSVWVEDHKPPE